MSDSVVQVTPQRNERLLLRRWTAWLLYGEAMAIGVAQACAPPTELAYFLLMVLMASTATMWCVLDARESGRNLEHAVQIVLFFLWPIAVPLYLVRSRNLRGLWLAMLNAAGLYAVAVATFVVVAILRFGLP